MTVSAGAPSARGAARRCRTVRRVRGPPSRSVSGMRRETTCRVRRARSRCRCQGPIEGLGQRIRPGRRAATRRRTPRTKAGTDQVQVRVSGTAVRGSPFASAVQAGDADAGASQAVVPACVESSDLPARITITAFDAFGNRVTRGGDDFRIRVNQGTPIKPTDNGDGTYTARLNLDDRASSGSTSRSTANQSKGAPIRFLCPSRFPSARTGNARATRGHAAVFALRCADGRIPLAGLVLSST